MKTSTKLLTSFSAMITFPDTETEEGNFVSPHCTIIKSPVTTTFPEKEESLIRFSPATLKLPLIVMSHNLIPFSFLIYPIVLLYYVVYFVICRNLGISQYWLWWLSKLAHNVCLALRSGGDYCRYFSYEAVMFKFTKNCYKKPFSPAWRKTIVGSSAFFVIFGCLIKLF